MTPSDLLALGWHLLPIQPGTKVPLDGQGLDHATTDAATVAAWQARGCDWAVACAPSGLVALDVDPRHGGAATWADLCQRLGCLPPHPWQTTRGGGWHHLVRDPCVDLRGTLGDGVDIKRRGYILIDPSPGYVLTGADVPPPDLPASWLDACRKPAARRQPLSTRALSGESTRYGLAALERECTDVAAELEGGRNNRLNRAAVCVAALVAGGELHEADARPALMDAAVACGLPEREAERTIASGWSHGLTTPRTAPPRLSVVPAVRDDEPPPHEDDEIGAPVSELPGCDIPGPDDWRMGLATHETSDGTTVLDKTPGNLTLLLTNEPAWVGTCCYDELAHTVRWRRPPPSVPGLDAPDGQLRDSHLVYVQHAARRQWGLTWGLEAVHAAIVAASEQRRYHPVAQYLRSLEWDGVERLSTWLQVYHGCTDEPAPVGRWWMISAVARAMRPGCQADHVLVLQGKQGAGKSTALRTLAREWYNGTLGNLRDKDAQQGLSGSWIIEIGELDALRGAAQTRVKDFISQTVDKYRPSYGRCTVERPRACVFAGTTNEAELYQDTTGARRFWTVRVHGLDAPSLERDLDQLWAEAVAAYRAGERWWPTEEEHIRALADAAEDRYQADTWEATLHEWLAGPRGGRVTMDECLKAVGVEIGKSGQGDARRIAAILRRNGWDQRRSRRLRWWELAG